MKTPSLTIYLCFSLCLSFSLFFGSCNESENPEEQKIVKEETQQDKTFKKLKKQKIIICGEIDEFNKNYSFTLYSRYFHQNLTFDSLKFKVELESDLPIIAIFQNSRTFDFPIFAMPGDSIHIDLKFMDAVNRKHTQTFSGSSVNENILMSRLKQKLVLDNNLHRHQYNVAEADFLNKIDSLQTKAQALKESFTSIGSIKNSYFEKYYDLYLSYKLAGYLGNYPSVLKQYDPSKVNQSDNYYEKYNSYFVENADYLNIPPYTKYLYRQMYIHADKIFNERNYDKQGRPSIDPAVKYYVIDSLFTNQEVIDYQKYAAINDEVGLLNFRYNRMIRMQDLSPEMKNFTVGKVFFDQEYGNHFEADYEIYKKMNPPKEYLDLIEKKYQKLMSQKTILNTD